MTTLHERVQLLEASVFRTEHHEEAQRAAAEQVAERVEAFAGQAAHLRDGIDTVSGDLRALTNELHAEVVPRLDEIDARLSSLEQGQQAMLGRLGGVENRIGGVENRLGDVENRLGGVENRLGGVEQGIAALLAHFDITAPPAA